MLFVDAEGNNLGEKTLFEAQNLAREAGLDLVEISPNNHPPVAKVMDFGKFKYDLAKQAKKNQATKSSELKEIRLSANIDDHDIAFKAKQALSFLEKGHQVHVTMRLVGRQNIFADRAIQVFKTFAEMNGLTYENPPRKTGNRIEAHLIRPKEKSPSPA